MQFQFLQATRQTGRVVTEYYRNSGQASLGNAATNTGKPMNFSAAES